VLLPAYRGRGLGVRFFEERERYALELGRFTHAAFCAVERPDGHPSRPPDYVPLDAFWRRRGYTRHPELVTTYSWRDVGEAQETAKPMVFWLKALREEARAPGG
jgi:GNAT superfamily N-acetyltransferase